MAKPDQAMMEKLKTRKDIKSLVRLMNEKGDPDVVRQAMKILAELGATMLPDLERWHNYVVDFTSSKRLVEVFGMIGPSAIPILEGWIQDIPHDTGGNGFLDTVVLIFNTAKNRNNLTYDALNAFTYMETPGAIALIRAYQTKIVYPNGALPGDICRRIISIGEPAVEPLLTAMQDEKLSNLSIRVLGEIKISNPATHQRVKDNLLEMLRVKNYDDADCMKSLANQGVEVLIDESLLNIFNVLGTAKLVRILKTYQAPFMSTSKKVSLYQQVVSSLSASNSQVRLTAAILLGETGYPDGIKPLVACINDPDFGVAIAVGSALQKLGWRDPAVYREVFRGGLGEPYCSEKCQMEAANYALMEIPHGQCGVCHNNLSTWSGQRDYAVIPYEGKILMVCQNCASGMRVKFQNYHKCCKCQKDI